jgi:hypothetical protein
MRLLDLLQNLPLTAMFVATLAIGLALCWAILLLVLALCHNHHFGMQAVAMTLAIRSLQWPPSSFCFRTIDRSSARSP